MNMNKLVPRSYLFVPGNRPDRYAKALAAGADAVIVDLEDAVPPDNKPSARSALAAWLSPEHAVLLRLNGAESQWFREDLPLCKMQGVAGVLLPHAGNAADPRPAAPPCRAATPPFSPVLSPPGFWQPKGR